MKAAVLLAGVLGLVVAEGMGKYHQRVGIPTAAKIRQQESMRIAGGLASFKGEHPFLAGLIITLKTGETSVCGGSLLSHYHVLTIAQCWSDGEDEAMEAQVVLGTVTLFTGGTRVYAVASNVTVHPEYDPSILANDIAMMIIPYVWYNSYVSPIILPEASFTSLEAYRARITGFGRTGRNVALDGGSSLRDVFVTVISNAQCKKTYGSIVTDDVMCTSGANGKGACNGDYGSPLILRRYRGASGKDLLVGLVSFIADAGCNEGYPTGYVRVTSYVQWIKQFLY